VGLRAGMDTEVRGKILCPCQGSNLDRLVVQSYSDTILTELPPLPIQRVTCIFYNGVAGVSEAPPVLNLSTKDMESH
jgi:hypothetical protein